MKCRFCKAEISKGNGNVWVGDSSGRCKKSPIGLGHEPEPTEAAPSLDPSRCSLDGAARIPLDRERTKFGVCTLVAGKDGKGGCKDPLHDYNAEREAVVGGQPPKVMLSESEQLSMFRNAFYSAMGIHNYADKPTDSECLRWLAKVRIHAEKLQNFPMQLPAVGGLPYWKKWIEE